MTKPCMYPLMKSTTYTGPGGIPVKGKEVRRTGMKGVKPGSSASLIIVPGVSRQLVVRFGPDGDIGADGVADAA